MTSIPPPPPPPPATAAATVISSIPPADNNTLVEDRNAYDRFHTAIGSVVDSTVTTESSTMSTTHGAVGPPGAGAANASYDPPRGGNDTAQQPMPPPPPQAPPQAPSPVPSPAHAQPSSPDRHRNEIAHQSNIDDNNENNNNNNNNNHPNLELSNAELRRRFSESVHQQSQRSPSFHLGTDRSLILT